MTGSHPAAIDVSSIKRIDHDEAMQITSVENRKFSELMCSLSPQQWSTQTECTLWDVRAMAAHLVGSAASQASPREFFRQKRGGKPICEELGSPFWWDGMNELQVRERASLTTADAAVRCDVRRRNGYRTVKGWIVMPREATTPSHEDPQQGVRRDGWSPGCTLSCLSYAVQPACCNDREMGIKVLLCTDGSELATTALRDALPVLAPADRVVMLTVETLVDPVHETGTGFTISPASPHGEEQIETSGDRAAKKILDDTVAALGLEGVELMAVSGRPGEMICEVAVSMSADVIVMGTNGRSGFKRAVVGSTSDYVVRYAVCPVLVQGAG